MSWGPWGFMSVVCDVMEGGGASEAFYYAGSRRVGGRGLCRIGRWV